MRLASLRLTPILVLSFLSFGGCGSSGDDADNGGSGSGGTSHGGAGGTDGGGQPGDCETADCGPELGIPNWPCDDGSMGGPTGRCVELPGVACGWEIRECPMLGEGGAASSQGGQGNAAGATGTGGAAADDCGGCSVGEVCVLQAGGPGPSHFICATQNPCGSAAACACIVGQGTCQPDLMGDPPRYCACDNGLD